MTMMKDQQVILQTVQQLQMRSLGLNQGVDTRNDVEAEQPRTQRLHLDENKYLENLFVVRLKLWSNALSKNCVGWF